MSLDQESELPIPSELLGEIDAINSTVAKAVVSNPEMAEATVEAPPVAPEPVVTVSRPHVPSVESAAVDAVSAQPQAVVVAQPTPAPAASATPLGEMPFEFVDDSEFPAIELDQILSKKTESLQSGYGVICMRSNYYSEMKGLDLTTRGNLMNNNLPPYDYWKRLFQTIHSRIVNMTVGIPPFEIWLKMTAYTDLETLYFGIFAKTWPDGVSFDVTCPKCDVKNKAKVKAEDTLVVKDEEVYSRIRSVNQTVETHADIRAGSMLARNVRVRLPQTQFVFEIKIPSLHDYLEMVRKYSNGAGGTVAPAVSTLMYVKDVYFPSEALRKYVRITDPDRILSIISSLPVQDIDKIESEMKTFVERYEIEYRIPAFNCHNCQSTIESVALDLENLVFMKVNGRI